MLDMNLDYAKDVNLTLRRSGFYELTITTFQDSTPFDFSTGQVQLLLFNNKHSQVPFLTKVSGVDIDYINIASNVITLKLWQDLSVLNTSKYFWCLVWIDANNESHYWLVGDYKIISGQSEEDVSVSSVNLTITEPLVNIYLNIFSGGGGSAAYSSIYNALLSQSSTSAPSAVELANTMISAPVWSRVSAGVYKLSQTGGFDLAKTSVYPICNVSNFVSPNYVIVKFHTDNNLLVQTYNSNQVLSDGILSSFPLRIEIYP